MEKQQRQEPIGSGFGAAATAADTIKGIELKGKTVIVTGGYSGIGFETTRVLHEAGASVIVPAEPSTLLRQACSKPPCQAGRS